MESIEKHSEQQWSLVTGATSGIGVAFSKDLAKQNKPVILVARNAAKLKAVSDGLTNQYGVLTRYIAADLSTRDGVNNVINECKSVHIDLLTNNAGKEESGRFLNNDIDEMLNSIALKSFAFGEVFKMVLKGKLAFLKAEQAQS
jgi:short-subunit dehydrogenase